jgi:lipopolysaccharide/colanic/teichoic acid biosynthesis glycosyltransferase
LSPALPSLITVLKGDLSLVGTVPLTPDEAKAQERKLAGFWRRNLIKPGIWGPAHFHDESSYFDYELKYMKHMSILTDIYWILVGPLRCMFAMGKRKNVGSEIY